MNMMKYLKPTAIIALVASIAVGGTLAYLQDKTTEVKNSFTFSDDAAVDITLKEETFGEEGNTDAVPMVPGCDIDKDPQITIEGNDCYIYVDVVENCGIEGYAFSDFIAYDMNENWKEVTGVSENPAGTKTYVYTAGTSEPVAVEKTATDLYILKDNKVSVKDTVSEEMLLLAKTTNPSLSFVGYALQAENLEAAQANASFIEAFKTTTV